MNFQLNVKIQPLHFNRWLQVARLTIAFLAVTHPKSVLRNILSAAPNFWPNLERLVHFESEFKATGLSDEDKGNIGYNVLCASAGPNAGKDFHGEFESFRESVSRSKMESRHAYTSSLRHKRKWQDEPSAECKFYCNRTCSKWPTT